MNREKNNMNLLMPSQLPQKDRIDIYKFLIDNKIKFKREPNGEYASIIHILNPMYCNHDLKEKQNIINSSNNQTKPQSPSLSASLTKTNTNTKMNTKPIRKTSSEPKLLIHRSDSDNHLYHQKHFLKIPINSKQNNTNSNYCSQRSSNYNEAFSHLYLKFYSEVKPMIGIRGKKYNLYQLKLLIEEMYSDRFIQDTAIIKTQLGKDKSESIDLSNNTPFPIFVYQFLSSKHLKKPAIDQWALNMLLTIEHFKSINKEIEVFSKLLSEEYDNDDLVLFLFVRSCIEKEVKMAFPEKAQNETNLHHHAEGKDSIDTEWYLSCRSCFNSNR